MLRKIKQTSKLRGRVMKVKTICFTKKATKKAQCYAR